MDMEGALRARLTGLAGGRIYWDERPQSSALPSVTLQVISDIRPQHMKGFNDLKDTRVQVDCWGATYAVAKALKEAVIAAAVPESTANGIRFDRAVVDGGGSGVELLGTASVFRQRVDLLMWWTTS